MSEPAKLLYEFGPFVLDAKEQVLLRDGSPVPLKPKVFDLLQVLVEESGHVLHKNELMRKVWPNAFVEESNLSVSIFALRKVLGEGPSEHSYIETVPRRGYRFIAEVTTTDADVSVTVKHERRMASAIAVLPFKMIGREPRNEYLGLGIADALISKLANLREISVRPTSSVRKYTHQEDLDVIARALRVSLLLDGTIQQSGNRLRVTVQLVDTGSNTPLWAEKFDDKVANIFDIEDSISDKVIRVLAPKLTRDERRQLARRPTASTEAYQAYLKGFYLLNKRPSEAFQQSIGYFERAISIDPNYAKAYAGLANSCYFLSSYNALPPREIVPKAKEAVLRALQLDDSLAEAHASLAILHRREWDWIAAEREFKRAIELNPNYAGAHQWYSVLLRAIGRFDESWEQIEIAQELDPVSLSINAGVGFLLYFTRRYERALEQLEATVELDANYASAHVGLGVVFAAKEMYCEAIKQYQETSRLVGKNQELTGYLGHSYALSDRKVEARKALSELKRLSEQGYESGYFLALIYTALNDREQAFVWLEKAYDRREEMLGLLKIDPMLDQLRKDPRFMNLMRRVGFTQ